jgi:hypothetical protein
MDSHLIQVTDEHGQPALMNISENWIRYSDGRQFDMGAPNREFDHKLAMYANLRMCGAQDVMPGERVVKMDLGTADVHIDQALSNYATGWTRQPGTLIADEVSPVIPANKMSDYYYKYDKDDRFQMENMAVVPGGNVHEVSPKQSSTTYTCKGYGLKTHLPAEVEGNSDNALMLAMRFMTVPLDKLRLGREFRVATVMMTAASYSTAKVTLGGTEKWNGGSASNPIKNIHDLCDLMLVQPNRLVMAGKSWRAFQTNAQVQKFIASKTETRPLAKTNDPNEWAAILSLPRIIVGEERYKSAASTFNTFVWGANALLFYLPPTIPPMGQPITGNTFRFTGGSANGQVVEGGIAVRSFYDPTRGVAGGKTVVCYHYDADVLVEEAAGGMIEAAYQ